MESPEADTALEDVSRHFARMAAETTFEHLGPAADFAKKSILDTVGVAMAAGGAEPAVRAAVDVARDGGGHAEATVLDGGAPMPALHAAFANGAMAHCLDFDDRTPWGQHGSSTIVPAVLALAERKGDVSGRELIAAVAVGQDIFMRLRAHVGWRKDWNLSTVLGVYGGAAAGAKILGLDANQIHAALGIASQQSSGVHEVMSGTGSDLRGMYAGFSAKGGVLAALLAQRGVKGVEALFEGHRGVFETYFRGEYDREGMLEGLGSDFRGALMLYKMWPAVGVSHNHVHATIELMADCGLRPADLEEIRVHVGDYHRLMCEPLDTRRRPATRVDAKFSLPFIVAIAAVRGGVRVADFSDEALRDPDVLAMARRVTPVDDPALDWKRDVPGGRVELRCKDGRTFSRSESNHPGSRGAPLTWAELGRKFSDCVSVARSGHTARQVGSFVATVRTLEDVQDAHALLRLLHREP